MSALIAKIVKSVGLAVAESLISALWAAGDWVFDRFVRPGRGLDWRNKTLVRWTERCRKNDEWEPINALGKTWKENRRNALVEAGEYMGFAKYVTLSQKAERLLNGGATRLP
jgi:hypothetical protein